MTSDLTSALEVSHIMCYANRRILYFTLLTIGASVKFENWCSVCIYS